MWSEEEERRILKRGGKGRGSIMGPTEKSRVFWRLEKAMLHWATK